MKVLFRADASLQIGSGHVMRCLSLADALRSAGAECEFICRAHPGHLIDFIESKGFKAHALMVETTGQAPQTDSSEALPAHAHWLGVSWQRDAQECAEILVSEQPAWLVLDHYALDEQWERSLRHAYRKLLVIDDLADRSHECDVLLDQNLGREAAHYLHRVPARCQLLVGAQFALLRPEFHRLRTFSLQRRANSSLGQILISMGGVDLPNATQAVLQALRHCPLPANCRITVVMGATAPWLNAVSAEAQSIPWPTEVVVNVSNMAERMAQSDLAIGAAGSTSWERCCLGLPTLMVTLAENQVAGATALQSAGAALWIGDVANIEQNLQPLVAACLQEGALSRMSAAAAAICDGRGLESVVDYLTRNEGGSNA